MIRLRGVGLPGILAVFLSLLGCQPPSSSTSAVAPAVARKPTTKPATNLPAPPPLRFRDATDASGVGFVHCSGFDAMKHFPTSFGGGVALIDYDGDGKLDLYFCSARHMPLSAPEKTMGNRLYRNLGGLKFEDVTDRAGVGFHGFCNGVAVGDVNGDGRPDLFLTNLGANVLYLNNGDGTFRDASAGSGAQVNLWSLGAAFLDYDNDGKLDLYVSCYGQWTEEGPHEFQGDVKRNIRLTESPFSIRPQRHFLFRGRGDGTFEDRTKEAGVLRRDGRGLAVIAADVNGDGLADLYVANDGCPNFLFLNKGDGTFDDITASSGAAVDSSGAVQGSMGADIQDVDGDGRPELFVTNFRGQPNTLYQNIDGRNYLDVSALAGIVKDSLPYVKWGCALADFDNDGWPDIFTVNGEVDDNLREFGQEIDYEQPVILWGNLGGGRFARVRDPGPFFARNYPARGAAFGDLDDDGDLDVVISMMDRRPAILANESPQGNWIRFALDGRAGNRDAIGATVNVFAGGRAFQRLIRGGDSYLSANDRRALIGLGPISKVERVEITWPGGARTTIPAPEVGRTHRVIQPEGEKTP